MLVGNLALKVSFPVDGEVQRWRISSWRGMSGYLSQPCVKHKARELNAPAGAAAHPRVSCDYAY